MHCRRVLRVRVSLARSVSALSTVVPSFATHCRTFRVNNRHGRKFGVIARVVGPPRTPQDCVEFYYRNKYRVVGDSSQTELPIANLVASNSPTTTVSANAGGTATEEVAALYPALVAVTRPSQSRLVAVPVTAVTGRDHLVTRVVVAHARRRRCRWTCLDGRQATRAALGQRQLVVVTMAWRTTQVPLLLLLLLCCWRLPCAPHVDCDQPRVLVFKRGGRNSWGRGVDVVAVAGSLADVKVEEVNGRIAGMDDGKPHVDSVGGVGTWTQLQKLFALPVSVHHLAQ